MSALAINLITLRNSLNISTIECDWGTLTSSNGDSKTLSDAHHKFDYPFKEKSILVTFSLFFLLFLVNIHRFHLSWFTYLCIPIFKFLNEIFIAKSSSSSNIIVKWKMKMPRQTLRIIFPKKLSSYNFTTFDINI